MVTDDDFARAAGNVKGDPSEAPESPAAGKGAPANDVPSDIGANLGAK
jgi:hypothetical protein